MGVLSSAGSRVWHPGVNIPDLAFDVLRSALFPSRLVVGPSQRARSDGVNHLWKLIVPSESWSGSFCLRRRKGQRW